MPYVCIWVSPYPREPRKSLTGNFHFISPRTCHRIFEVVPSYRHSSFRADRQWMKIIIKHTWYMSYILSFGNSTQFIKYLSSERFRFDFCNSYLGNACFAFVSLLNFTFYLIRRKIFFRQCSSSLFLTHRISLLYYSSFFFRWCSVVSISKVPPQTFLKLFPGTALAICSLCIGCLRPAFCSDIPLSFSDIHLDAPGSGLHQSLFHQYNCPCMYYAHENSFSALLPWVH